MATIVVKKKSAFTKLYFAAPIVKFMIALGLLVFIDAVGILYFKSQAGSELVSIKLKKEALEKEVGAEARARGQLPNQLKNIQSLQDNFTALSASFSSESQVGDLLAAITKLGTAEGLKFVHFKPKDPVVSQYFSYVPVDISVIGDFNQIGRFLSGIANLPKSIVAVDQFTLTHPSPADPLLNLNFTASIYYTTIQQTDKKA